VARLAFGLKVHSGWAALVAVAEREAELDVVERRRLELVDAADRAWAAAPYHAAAGLDPAEAEPLVARAERAAAARAEQALAAALAARRAHGDAVVACGVLVGAGRPPGSVAALAAVHVRMHQAEGALFQQALLGAAQGLGLEPSPLREKQIEALATEALSLDSAALRARLAAAGRRAGPPWARDQKDAACAAWIALRRAARG
jgi:hypothetical protein